MGGPAPVAPGAAAVVFTAAGVSLFAPGIVTGLLGYRAGNGGAGGEVKVAHTTFPVPFTVV